jgi:hypothetical protein
MTRPAAPLLDLVAQLREFDPAALAAVPLAEVPVLLGQLELVKVMLLARLTMAAPAPAAPVTPEDDAVRDVAEVARLVGHSISWVRKNGHRLPGFHQPGGKGTRVAWSRRALATWVCTVHSSP